MAVRAIIFTVAVVLILAATSVTVYTIKNKNKPHNPNVNSTPDHPAGVLWYNATVSKTRQGAYRTIMEALVAAPAYIVDKYHIHIEARLYEERVDVSEQLTNIVFVGDGEDVTRISGSRRYPEFRTIDTAIVAIEGNGFIAMFIAFENHAGDGSQAVAVMSMLDQSAFYRCTFLGYQDTRYTKSGAQFYRECNIYGTVDFIFGAARAVFQSCYIYSRLPRSSPFTAQNRDPIYLQSGFVIHNCTLTVAPRMEQQKSGFEAYLGRPWSNYSTVIVMESFLDSIIKPEAWLYWEGRSTDALTYREFGNRGPGAPTNGRVHWQGFKVVTLPSELLSYTAREFIDDKDWLRHTGIPNTRGFIYHE